MRAPLSLPQHHRARDILTAVGRAYPQIWRQIDQVRQAHEDRAWPSWCFMPLREVHTLITGGRPRLLPYEVQHHPSIVGALAAWRVTQGIYRFDPTIYQALIQTPLTRDLPIEALTTLPEWSTYVETPGLIWKFTGEARPIHGAWAHLDVSAATDGPIRPEVRLVLDTARVPSDPFNAADGCVAIPLVGRGTIAESLERVLALGIKDARSHGVKISAELEDPERIARILAPVLSLLLYICSESGHIGDGAHRPAHPKPIRTRHGWRHFPKDLPTMWDVGVRTGAALRRAGYASTHLQTVPTGRHLRGHVRIFHWHTFLAGPGRTERRVKWLPPIRVNLDDPEDLPATVRSVE